MGDAVIAFQQLSRELKTDILCNLASVSAHAKTIAQPAKWLPNSEAPDAAFDADLKRGNAKGSKSGKKRERPKTGNRD